MKSRNEINKELYGKNKQKKLKSNKASRHMGKQEFKKVVSEYKYVT
jgi:hypothetical protein